MALADALQTLLRLPGATYACVVERDSGRVLAELGRGEAGAGDSEGVVPYSVPRWGTAVAAMFDTTSGDELDDVMITGRRSYHLVRPLGSGAAVVLVYLRLDRSRSNLAAARRELAAVRFSGIPAADGAGRTGADRSGDDAARPAPADRTSASGTPASRTPARPARRRAAEAPPTRIPAALAPPTTPARGVPGPAAPAASEPAGAAPVASAGGRELPRARSSGRSSGSSPAPARSRPGSEATRQIPLPRRAPGRSTSDGPARRPESRARTAVAASAEPVPEGFAVPAVLGQSWARDPGTLRRLLAGLRRMA